MTINSSATTVSPIEWLHSLRNIIDDFFETQCRNIELETDIDNKSTRVNNKLQASVRKVTASTHKSSSERKSSLPMSTPLKDKDKSPNNISSILSSADFTPKPSQLPSATETPFTEARARRTAATKADKYIDIVSRRLAQVPANGSTPKSMKIASKLISEATPNSKRNILLSSTLKPSAHRVDSISQSGATPMTVRKKNRVAKVREIFNTPLFSLATAAASTTNEANSLSPAGINFAPSKISQLSKLNPANSAKKSPNQIIKIENRKSSFKLSPIKNVDIYISPLKDPIETPLRRSQRVSPSRSSETLKYQKKPSPLKDQVKAKAPQLPALLVPSVSATPKASKAPVVEFVAPQSVLRSSKRPRNQVDTSIYTEDSSTPAVKKQAKFLDPSIFPTVSVNSQTHVKIAPPKTPQVNNTSLPTEKSSIVLEKSKTPARISNIVTNVPAIIVPLSTARPDEGTSSSDDLAGIETKSTKRTPLRVQPLRTPTRAKAVIPSLSDYSAATKIAVIEVAKNNSNSNSASNNLNNANPKVEPWTNRFMQKDAIISNSDSISAVAPPVKSSLNLNIKPLDTSKITGFSNSNGSTSVPIVPKFPLNLANISNITKSNLHLEPETKSTSNTTASSMSNNSSNTVSVNSTNLNSNSSESTKIPPPESPLSRAKRIDYENSIKDEKTKIASVSESKTDKLKKAIRELSSENMNDTKQSNLIPSTIQNTSKLPVKPKSSAAVLPSPKIPSRLAEAFSGIDSELPPIDMAGMVDDEKILKNVLSGGSVKVKNNLDSTGLANPKMKKQPVNNPTIPAPVIPSTPTSSAAQLHRTAVLNSAARKINPPNIASLHTVKPATTIHPQTLPTTPKPQASITAQSKPSVSIDSSSPNLPDIPSDDELDKREKMQGKENRPTWAMTPNLTVALNAQKSQRAEDVFGKVQPIKLEDFFKGSGKKFPNRSSTSNWNNNI